MASVFDLNESKIDDDSSPNTIETWDSLRHINLIIALEEEFGLELENESITNMTSFREICNIIEKKSSA